MAGRIIFQMDQAATANQVIFRHFRECGEDSDMDCDFRVCRSRHHQKTAPPQHRSLHNFTDFEPHTIRENPFKAATFEHRLQY